MKRTKQKRIPCKYRGKPDSEKQIRVHHKAFFAFTVGGMMRPLEPDDTDGINER